LKKFDTINVVPFIDIMLVLLAIVLTTATFIATGKIKLNLPAAKNSTISTKQIQKTIIIKKNGEIFFNNKKITLNLFKNSLKHIAKDTLIVIKSDKDARFEIFVKIIDILKEMKHDNIAIVTLRDNKIQ
jgi:biopolymer transport protein ExbD